MSDSLSLLTQADSTEGKGQSWGAQPGCLQGQEGVKRRDSPSLDASGCSGGLCLLSSGSAPVPAREPSEPVMWQLLPLSSSQRWLALLQPKLPSPPRIPRWEASAPAKGELVHSKAPGQGKRKAGSTPHKTWPWRTVGEKVQGLKTDIKGCPNAEGSKSDVRMAPRPSRPPPATGTALQHQGWLPHRDAEPWMSVTDAFEAQTRGSPATEQLLRASLSSLGTTGLLPGSTERQGLYVPSLGTGCVSQNW